VVNRLRLHEVRKNVVRNWKLFRFGTPDGLKLMLGNSRKYVAEQARTLQVEMPAKQTLTEVLTHMQAGRPIVEENISVINTEFGRIDLNRLNDLAAYSLSHDRYALIARDLSLAHNLGLLRLGTHSVSPVTVREKLKVNNEAFQNIHMP
jgi:hypothetical protein